jgi:hypothetical protein
MQVQLPVSADSNNTLVAGFHEGGPSVATGFEWQEVDDATRSGLSRATKTAEQIIDRLRPPRFQGTSVRHLSDKATIQPCARIPLSLIQKLQAGSFATLFFWKDFGASRDYTAHIKDLMAATDNLRISLHCTIR